MTHAVHPSASYSFTIRVSYPNAVGMLGKVTSAIGKAGGDVGAVDIAHVSDKEMMRDITIAAASSEHGLAIIRELEGLPKVRVVKTSDRTFLMHLGGKIVVNPRRPVKTRDTLSMVYTPGVARICRAIQDNPEDVFTLTIKRNIVAVVTDGSAVLGLGNIGPEAALPVMEGKAVLFKEFGGVDAFPICLDTQDVEEIIKTVAHIAPVFGGINLEDISAPRCFEIEQRLHEMLDIPVFHDDQHGTAVVALAALLNAVKIVNKEMAKLRIVIAGAGAAGVACTKLLLEAGVTDIVLTDSRGIVSKSREGLTAIKQWIAGNTNPRGIDGTLADALKGADVFIGVSAPNIATAEMIEGMANDPIVFALSNPDPEITPEEAGERVRVMATGRSDYPNQINNVLGFPGIFKGLLECRAREVNSEMKLAAARAIASVVPSKELHEEYIIPSVFNKRVVAVVSKAVIDTARKTGVARREVKHQEDPDETK